MMNDNTRRGLLIAGLSANVLFMALALIDYARFDSQYMWPIFVGWAVLIILLVVLALATASWRSMGQDGAAPALARAVANLSARPAPQAATVVHQHTPRTSVLPPAKPGKLVELEEDKFPFTYNGYTLYSRSVALKSGGERTIWFFSKRKPASGEMARKPSGFHVGVNERTGLPFLKKGGGKDGEDLTPRLEPSLRPQCSALTEDGKQCRNSARADSKYCASHFGYQPPTIAKAEAARKDTRARVKGAKDTVPSVRKKASA